MPTGRKEYWIDKLRLEPHPEGGFFRETYRSGEVIPRAALPERFSGDRAFSTCIYFLLDGGSFSAFHRIRQDELWHFYDGSPMTIHVISPDGTYSPVRLGKDVDAGEYPQAVIEAGCWFAAETNDKRSFTLAGCTVAPGFDFDDFEMPGRGTLLDLFPQHREVIERFTRSSQ